MFTARAFVCAEVETFTVSASVSPFHYAPPLATPSGYSRSAPKVSLPYAALQPRARGKVEETPETHAPTGRLRLQHG